MMPVSSLRYDSEPQSAEGRENATAIWQVPDSLFIDNRKTAGNNPTTTIKGFRGRRRQQWTPRGLTKAHSFNEKIP